MLDLGRELADQLRSDLAPGSEKVADETRTRFGRQALSERLMPNIDNDAMGDQLESKRCHPVETHYPLFPAEARRRFIQGRVSVEFTVHADGSAREYALRGTPDEANVKQAKLWLERAVARGSRDGKLYLAALLAAAPYGEMRDPARALSLIEPVFAGVDDDPTAFEIRAAAAANSGNFANAVMYEAKALDRAKRLSWDVAPLRERWTRYQSGQPWYGDLLGF